MLHEIKANISFMNFYMIFVSFEQYYPEMVEAGGHVVMIDVNADAGGLTLNPDFFVDFGKEPNGPTLPHGNEFNSNKNCQLAIAFWSKTLKII